MSLPAPTYDLVLLLDPESEEDTRAKLVSTTRSAIESQGELLRHDGWGERALAYPIRRRASAEYHLLQFHAASPELLRELGRTLRIADEVLRFRIIKLRPGVPEAPDMHASAAPRRATNGAEPRTATSDEPEQLAAAQGASAPAAAPAQRADAGANSAAPAGPAPTDEA